MIQIDEIRDGVSLSPMFYGETRLGPMVVAVTTTGGPFYCPSFVVGQPLPSSTPEKERNDAEPRRIPRSSKRVQGLSAPDVVRHRVSPLRAHTGATASIREIALQRPPGGKRKSEVCLESELTVETVKGVV